MRLRLFNREYLIALNGLNVSRRLEFRWLSRCLRLKGDELLLDVACGDGYWTAKFATRARVFGFDLNTERLRQAQRRLAAPAGLLRCDAHHLPFKDAAFDAAVGVCVLEHFEDDVQALQELRRVVRLGGKLALSVDSFSYPGISAAQKAAHAQKYSVKRHYRLADLEAKLNACDFTVQDWSYLLRTPLSAALYRLALRHPKLAVSLFPISYLISSLAETCSQRNEFGYKLAIAALAEASPAPNASF